MGCADPVSGFRRDPDAINAGSTANLNDAVGAAMTTLQTLNRRTLTLVVTFNEADNIARLIPAILRSVPETHVLVVDDNSPDGTADVVRQYAELDSRVAVICRTTERGYGSAMIAGMRRAIDEGFDAILTLDADFSHDPADLPKLLDALSGSDVAVGSRYVGGVRVLNWEVR